MLCRVPDDPGALGALERSQWQAPQDADDVGPAGDPANQTLVAKSARLPVFVADSGFARRPDLLASAVRGHVCMITRLRLDANLFRPAPETPARSARPRTPLKGRALPKLKVLC